MHGIAQRDYFSYCVHFSCSTVSRAQLPKKIGIKMAKFAENRLKKFPQENKRKDRRADILAFQVLLAVRSKNSICLWLLHMPL